jgi:hypothetical protein
MGQHAEQVARPAELTHLAVRGPHQRQRVTRGADPHHGPAGDKPHRGVDRGQEPRVIGRPVEQDLIQAGQEQARPGLRAGHGAQGVAGQRGAFGGGRPLAAHVADHDSPCSPRRREHVAEIREDLALRGVPRRDLQAGDTRQPRRQQAFLESPRQGDSSGAARQRGSQRNLLPGDLGQGLKNRDVAGTPLPCHLVGDPEHPHDLVVLILDRDPGPGQQARRIGPGRAAHAAVHPDVTDDQLVVRPDDIRAQPLFKRAQLAVDTRRAVLRK